MDYKKTNAPSNTITRNMVELCEDTGNVYETVAIIGKRAKQPSLWHILSSSMTGWENIICPCKEKETPPESCPHNMCKADTTVNFLPPGCESGTEVIS